MSKGKILVVDDEPNILKTLTLGLKSLGCEVVGFQDSEEALKSIDKDLFGETKFLCAFIDLMMHPMNGITLMHELHRRIPDLLVAIITAHGTVETAVSAMRDGAIDYLQKPFDIAELESFLGKIERTHQTKTDLKSDTGFITNNTSFQNLLKTAERIAKSNLTVLIEGETGTGKELLADFIHNNSERAGKPLLKLNCAALSAELIESELFGHIKGSYTGALKDRIGRAEAADGGTLFLDEVGEMPLPMQAKVLRFVQNREFQRIGENETRTSDVRIIAATNRNLEEEVERKGFREDLFYRLGGFRLLVPPLRHRKEDIIPLAERFVARASQSEKPIRLSEKVKDALLAYSWRGNIRELENVMIRAGVLTDLGKAIELQSLPEYIAYPSQTKNSIQGGGDLKSLEEVERDHIEYILSKTTSLEEAARILQIDSATLWRKRKKFGL